MDAKLNLNSIWEANNENTIFFSKLFDTPKPSTKKIVTPKIISQRCNGISFGTQKIKSLLFSTDMALIENNDADAVLAVYPFTPSLKIMKALIDFSEKPVICGVGGGLTKGKVSLEMAVAAQDLGAVAIIVNQPFTNKHIEAIKRRVNIPIISSVSVKEFSFWDRINAGVDIFHVSGGIHTSTIVEHIHNIAPGYPIIATGGKTIENIKTSINSGAQAIVLTPPSSSELFRPLMDEYRKGIHICKKFFYK